jgi:hypothetical protein
MFAPSVRKHTMAPACIHFLHLDSSSPISHSRPGCQTLASLAYLALSYYKLLYIT